MRRGPAIPRVEGWHVPDAPIDDAAILDVVAGDRGAPRHRGHVRVDRSARRAAARVRRSSRSAEVDRRVPEVIDTPARALRRPARARPRRGGARAAGGDSARGRRGRGVVRRAARRAGQLAAAAVDERSRGRRAATAAGRIAAMLDDDRAWPADDAARAGAPCRRGRCGTIRARRRPYVEAETIADRLVARAGAHPAARTARSRARGGARSRNMAHVRARLALIACVAAGAGGVAACGARPPAPVDVAHLDRRTLVAHVLAHPRDVQAHLALATLADRLGRPGEAIAQLQIVETLGGPLGVRWHRRDRARMARLLRRRVRPRGRAAVPRAPSPISSTRVRSARRSRPDVARLHAAAALAEVRHIDAESRAKGRALLAQLATQPEAEPRGAARCRRRRPTSTAGSARGCGTRGARREAYEQLELWKRTSAQAGPILDAYERAHAWWTGAAPDPCARRLARCRSCHRDAAIEDAPLVAAAVYAHARFPGAPAEESLLAVARAYRREPVVADRLGADLVASQVDEAAGHAALGALFDALGDPARARAHGRPRSTRAPSRRSCAGSPRPSRVPGRWRRGADLRDPGRRRVGRPGRGLDRRRRRARGVGAHVDAEACAHARSTSPAPSCCRARSTSRSRRARLGRRVAGRARCGPSARGSNRRRGRREPTDPAAAIVAYRTLPTAGAIARMWVAARANPADLEVRLALLAALLQDDPRRATRRSAIWSRSPAIRIPSAGSPRRSRISGRGR